MSTNNSPSPYVHADGPTGGIRGFLDEVAKRSWQSAMGVGAVSVALGAILFAWPSPTLHVVGILFGVFLLLTGIVQIAVTFAPLPAESGWWRFLTFLSGAVSIALAVVAFRDVVESLVMLAIWIGVGWLFRGISGLSFAFDLPHGAPGKTWGVILSLLTAVVGVVVVIYPVDSIPSLVLATGIALIVLGLAEFFHGLQIRSNLNRLKPQV